MKKKLVVVSLCGVVCLLVGAAITQVVEAQSKTISSWGQLVEHYYTARSELPPLPLPLGAEDILLAMAKNNWSFLSDGWQFKQSGGVWFVKEGSELSKLKLPLHVMILEDLKLGDVIVMSSVDGVSFQGEAIFDAPDMVEEASSLFTKRQDAASTFTEEEQLDALFWELSERRVVWSVVLKPASALAELFARSTPASTADGGGMMRSSSAPSNTLWLSIDGTTLTIHAPENFTNRMEIFSSDTLFDPWEIAVQSLQPVFTNPATWSPSPAPMQQFYCPGDMNRDTDEDGLPNDREKRVYKTNPDNPDSDGDGYSDGPTWPAGYGGVMRGTNDAFALDASAWRDTDGDGLPDEVVGTSTSEPQLVEDLDDDGDGTNEMTVAGIWLSAEEISGLATNGAQWENLLDEADRQLSDIDISNQDEFNDVYAMAKALVYARTGDSTYKIDVIDACSDAIGTESGGSSLALGRNLGGFIIAADLVDLPQADDMLFRDWLRTMLTNTMSDSLSLTTAHETRADNKGTHAGGARAAIAAYLQEWDELDDVATVFKGWAGDRTSHTFTDYGTNDTWQADTNAPVGINPKNAMIGTNSVDGVLPVAMQESGDFVWPPPQGDYAYEALQGALLQAVILDRAGHDVWNWEDKAVMRAYKWMDKKAKTRAQGDDSWQPFLVNHFYDTNLPTQVTSAHGKNIAPTDWTHPDLDRRIWISTDELAELPASGSQWNYLLTKSYETNAIDLSVRTNKNNVYTMAEAIVYARTGNEVNRSNVIHDCMAAIGTEAGGDSLALGQTLGAVVMAADLVGLPYEQDLIFRDWLKTCLTNEMSGGWSLTTRHEARPNFMGTYAGGTRAAIAVYLRDWDELDRVAQVFKGWLGDTNSYNNFTEFGTNLTWQVDQNNPVGINPVGATIQGYSVDGVLPDDQRQGGSFTTNWPPQPVSYVYEALQGVLMQAVILHRAGYDVWEWEDRAILRAYKWLYDEANYPADGYNEWQPFIINHFYETNFPTAYVSSSGKNLPAACWTHQKVVEEVAPNYSNATIIGNSMPGDWRPFSSTSPWNTPIPESAGIHSNSTQIMSLAESRRDHILLSSAFGSPLWVVNSSNALPITTNVVATTNLIWTYMKSTQGIFYEWDADNNMTSDIPIPLASTMYPEPQSDGHICILDPYSNLVYELSAHHGWGEGEMWSTNEAHNPPECTTFNRWDLNGDGYGADPTTLPTNSIWWARGGRGSGFPAIAGMVRPEELQAGEINHALIFTFGLNRWVPEGSHNIMMWPPACRSDGWYTNNVPSGAIYPIEGMRFRLDPSLTEEQFTGWGLTEEARIVARALQKYGMYLGDNGGSMIISLQMLGTNVTTNLDAWDRIAPYFHDSVDNIPTDAFYVVDDPNQQVIIK